MSRPRAVALWAAALINPVPALQTDTLRHPPELRRKVLDAHDVGDALVELHWSSQHTPKQAVPAYYLYPGAEPIEGSPFMLQLV